MTKQEPAPVPQAQPAVAAPVAEADLRCSDADRERVADLLRDAYAEGRLTVEEHSERIEAAYAAKTFGDLVPLTRDLPAATEGAPLSMVKPPLQQQRAPLPPARQEAPTMVAVFGGAERKGGWRVGPHLKAVA